MGYGALQLLVDWTCSTWLSLKYVGGEGKGVLLVLQNAMLWKLLFIRCGASDSDLGLLLSI